MIQSMTGFGRGEYNDGKRSVTVEIRSVNHRYSDIQVRMPRRYSFAEDTIKSVVKKYVSRGKIDVSVSIEYVSDSDINVGINKALAKKYRDSLSDLKDELVLGGEITIDLISQMPEVLKQTSDEIDEDEVKASFSKAAEAACVKFNEMRRLEGGKLAEDLKPRAVLIKDLVGEIEGKAAELPKIYKEKLRARVDELLDGGAQISEERFAVEVALFADKADITEEITRLKSHMDQMGEILSDEQEVNGKKLDFLVQEMNREANTIGSKANDLGITETMLKIKSEIEKIREQIQNIE